MGQQPKKTTHKKKFYLLFDTAFPNPKEFLLLSKKANLTHVRHTYNMSPTTEDKDIYQKACEEKRIVVSIDEDFKRLVKPGQAGAILIPADLSAQQMDSVLTEFILGKSPTDFIGKAEKINSET